jgi:hypothetical protein
MKIDFALLLTFNRKQVDTVVVKNFGHLALPLIAIGNSRVEEGKEARDKTKDRLIAG